MRKILPTALIIALTSTCVSDAQVKKSGGLFGFNRDEEQISSGLFPTEITTQPVSQTSTAPATNATAPSPQASPEHDGIFRGGSPTPVAPVSYVIEEGRKVDKSEKKSSFFGFGKKDQPDESDAPIVTPVPLTTPYFSTTADPAISKPAPAPAPAPQVAPTPVVMEEKKEAFVAERAEDTPAFETDEKESKSGGFFSFFSRKKSEPVAEMPTAAPAAPAEVAANTATGTVSTASDSADNLFEVPATSSEVTEPEKEKKSIAGTILSPVSKIRPQKKEIDFTGAETIISDGEIVNDDGQSLSSRIVTTQGDGKKDPPKIVNGVKTYSSWDDVEGRSVSAADKIINQIR